MTKISWKFGISFKRGEVDYVQTNDDMMACILLRFASHGIRFGLIERFEVMTVDN